MIDPTLRRVLDATDRTLKALEDAVKLGVSPVGLDSPSFRSPNSQEAVKRRRKHLVMDPRSGNWEERTPPPRTGSSRR